MSISSQKKESSESDRLPSKDEDDSSSSFSSSSFEEEKSYIKTSESAKSSSQQNKTNKIEGQKSVGLGSQDLIDGEDLLLLPDLDYVTIASQNKYFVEKDLVKDKSNIKADSYHLKDTNTLEKESMRFANPTSKKAVKNELQSNQANVDENELLDDDEYDDSAIISKKNYEGSSLVNMYFGKEIVFGKKGAVENFNIISENLNEILNELFKDYFPGKIENTRDGYLMSRIWKIEYGTHLVPDPSFFRDSSDICDEVKEDLTYTTIKQILQNENSEVYKGMDSVEFAFKEGCNVNVPIEWIERFYEDCVESGITKPKLLSVKLEFLRPIDEETMNHLICLLKSMSKLEIWFLNICFFNEWIVEAVELLLDFISDNTVKRIHFYDSDFDLNLLWSDTQYDHSSKWRFENCVISYGDIPPIIDGRHCIFKQIDFLKWTVKHKNSFKNKEASDPVFDLAILNHCLFKFRYRILGYSTSRKMILNWECCSFFTIQNHWSRPKHIKKFVYRAANQKISHYLNVEMKESTRQKAMMYYQEEDFNEDNYNKEKSFKLCRAQVTIDYNINQDEKVVQEVSVISMNMCQMLQLLFSLSGVSSCLIHSCHFELSSGHEWDSIRWELDELYLNNCGFLYIPEIKKEKALSTWGNKVIWVELFIKQLAMIEYKDNFELYFENKDVYFLVLSVIYRNNWREKGLEAEVDYLKRYISKSFWMNMIEIQPFRPKLNLFTFEDIRRCVQIQQKTSILLKSTQLVLWNCWITEPMFYYCLAHKGYFSDIFFIHWVVNIPEQSVKSFNPSLKRIKFTNWAIVPIKYYYFPSGYLSPEEFLDVELDYHKEYYYDNVSLDSKWDYNQALTHKKMLEMAFKDRIWDEWKAREMIEILWQGEVEFEEWGFEDWEEIFLPEPVEEQNGVKLIFDIFEH
jgi:hypothetical protein